MGSRSGWLPWLWAVTGGEMRAEQGPDLQAQWQRLSTEVDGCVLAGRQLRVLLAPPLPAEAVAAGTGCVSWYCLGPAARGYRAQACCRRNWRGCWQVSWQLQALDSGQLQHALGADAQASARVFGRLRGQRLYA
jgi:hypothetical protein